MFLVVKHSTRVTFVSLPAICGREGREGLIAVDSPVIVPPFCGYDAANVSRTRTDVITIGQWRDRPPDLMEIYIVPGKRLMFLLHDYLATTSHSTHMFHCRIDTSKYISVKVPPIGQTGPCTRNLIREWTE